MIRVEEFLTGQLSVPVADADDLPPGCFGCPYFAYKEFSVGDGAYYYFCGYHVAEKVSPAVAACGAE